MEAARAPTTKSCSNRNCMHHALTQGLGTACVGLRRPASAWVGLRRPCLDLDSLLCSCIRTSAVHWLQGSDITDPLACKNKRSSKSSQRHQRILSKSSARPAMAQSSLYEVLGVSKSATDVEASNQMFACTVIASLSSAREVTNADLDIFASPLVPIRSDEHTETC